MNAGFFYSLGYVIFVVFSTLWLQSLGKHFPVFMMLFVSSFYAILVFNIFNIKSFSKTHALIISDFRNWFLMNLFLMLAWVFTYLGAVANGMILLTVAFAANALFATIYTRALLKFLFLFFSILAVYFFNAEPGGNTAVFYGILTGLFSFLYFYNSDKFAKKHQANAIQVLSIRFYLLLLFSLGMMLAFNNEQLMPTFSLYDFFILLLLAIFNQILPNFFSQSGLQRLGNVKFSFFVTLAPLFAYLGNGVFYNDWTWHMCFLTLLITLALNYDSFRSLSYVRKLTKQT